MEESMSTEIVKAPPAQLTQFGEMSVQAVVNRKRKIQEVMEAVMIAGEHYGKIPGCGDKPALFKAGAEVLSMTFGLAPRFDVIERDLENGHREYRITCTLKHVQSGLDVGEGLGSASTMEAKHRWRKGERTCTECGKATIIKGKAEYGGGWVCFEKKGGCGFKWLDGDQKIEGQALDRKENPDIADVYNTVLKMAKKRAQVDATLTALGASDTLQQDIEDLPPGTIEVEAKERKPVPSNPKPWIVDLAACKSLEAVKALAPKINSMRKDSPERAEAMEAWTARRDFFANGGVDDVPPDDYR
jgi:hypothetical protein